MLSPLTALLMALSLVVNATAPLSQDAAEFAALITDVNAAHAKIDAPRADLSAYRYDFASGKPLFTMEDGALLKAFDGERPSSDAVLSASDAKKEVDWLFRLLRTQYGLYGWSGGDDAFEAVQAKITATLPKSGTIKLSDYEKLLADNLSFIKDAHFMIGSTNMWHPQQVFADQAHPFYRKDGAFYADASFIRKVVSVNGQAPESLIRRAIGQQGELTWYLYATAPKAESLSVSVQYADKTETVTLLPAASFEAQEPKADRYGVRDIGGVPYVEINEMFFGDGDSSGWTNQNDEDFKQKFLQTADDLKKSPAAVIDVSHNPGGNGALPDEWFARYTGQAVQPNYCTLRIRHGDVWLRTGYGAENAEQVAALRSDEDAMWEQYGLKADGAYYVGTPSPQFLKNDGRALFVLTSRGTQSAAENFTDVVHNLQNTVTIGSNTGGVLTNGANYGLKLPYSELPFQFGECLFLWDKSYFEEGRGIAPDVYLTGDNLDERLSLFLQRYAGAELQTAP